MGHFPSRTYAFRQVWSCSALLSIRMPILSLYLRNQFSILILSLLSPKFAFSSPCVPGFFVLTRAGSCYGDGSGIMYCVFPQIGRSILLIHACTRTAPNPRWPEEFIYSIHTAIYLYLFPSINKSGLRI